MISQETETHLIAIACQSRAQAYAPYSNYQVGAAILGEDGQIYSGANVENASYGLTVCAERVALFKAVTAGVRHIVAVAVCTQNGVAPCGACRQVLNEFGRTAIVYISDTQGHLRQTTMQALLPEQFSSQDLI